MLDRVRWIAAGVAVVVAAVVVVIALQNRPGASATVVDRAGDVFGGAPDGIERNLDLTSVEIRRSGDGWRVCWQLASAVDRRAIGPDPVRYDLRVQDAGVHYLVRVFVSDGRVASDVRDETTVAGSRPYVLAAPKVAGDTVEVQVPKNAMPKVKQAFSWGASATGAGSRDAAPADQAAIFPRKADQ